MSAPLKSLLTCATEEDCNLDVDDYNKGVARWCSGCGDHSVLSAMQQLLRKEQLRPEKTVFVSGIGCSSRFPHYMNTYGFHGAHGRALPVATGVKLARPDLHVFTVMGDGDCCSIGAGHWLHAIRYNVNMVALLLDNNIYGLTKKQTSPTTPQGYKSNTQPHGSYLPSLNPLTTTLGATNVSFLAQTADWVPAHLAATLYAAYKHPGFSFVRILQRCPVFTPDIFQRAAMKPELTEVLVHENGISDPGVEKLYPSHVRHDPSDLDAARELAEAADKVRIGLFFQDTSRARYEETRDIPHVTADDKIAMLNAELDRHAI
jgi:2-oxoglutarate ferredoxin oxidoreductase subunit beta